MSVFDNTTLLTSDETKLPIILWDDLLSLPTTTVSVSSEDTDFPVVNLLDDATNSKWKQTGSGNSNVDIDFGVSTTLDCVAVLCTRSVEDSEYIRVILRTSVDGVTWNSTGVTAFVYDGCAIITFDPTASRYWQVSINGDVGGMSVDTYVSRLMAGEVLRFPRGVVPPYTPIVDSAEIVSYPRYSRTGQFLKSKTVKMGLTQTLRLGKITEDFFLNSVLPFKDHFEEGKPFFFASSGQDGYRDAAYCWMNNNSPMTAVWNNTTDFRNVTMELAGYAG